MPLEDDDRRRVLAASAAARALASLIWRASARRFWVASWACFWRSLASNWARRSATCTLRGLATLPEASIEKGSPSSREAAEA